MHIFPLKRQWGDLIINRMPYLLLKSLSCGTCSFCQTALFSVCFYSRWWNDGRIKAALRQAYPLQLCHRIFPTHPLFTGVHFPIQQRPLIHGNLTHMSCMRNQELFMKVGVSENPVHPAGHLRFYFFAYECAITDAILLN